MNNDANNNKAAALAKILIRNFSDAPLHHDVREPLYDSMGARLATDMAAIKLGASIDIVAPGKRSCPYHFHHAQEEMFIILEGSGTLRVADEMLPLRVGDIAFIPPGSAYPHQIINSSDAPLKYLSVSTRDQPEIVEYPDSNKYLATATLADGTRFEGLQQSDNSLDYWENEP